MEGIVTTRLALFVAEISLVLSGFAVAIFVYIWAIRRNVRMHLEATVGLPTVLWRPKFLNYFPDRILTNESNGLRCKTPSQDATKMRPSSITNVLTRMERLNGPYGMYATVYGLQTKVIHIAHPVPAKVILQSCSLKAPGYDHFKNFCGEGVFTADGEDWRRKRSSVVHALFKQQQPRQLKNDQNSFTSPSNELPSPSFVDQIELESNEAATEFIRSFLNGVDRGKPADIVPLLQRATVNVIYRYLTHDKSKAPSEDEPQRNDERASNNKNPFLSILPSYLVSILQIRMIILAQARSFWFLLPRIFYTLFSPMYTAEEQAMRPIRHFALMACKNAKIGSPINVLQSKDSHCLKSCKTAVNADDREDIQISKALLDEAITLLFAGQDTSAATLSWTLHMLSLYPDIQEKVALEVRTVLAQENEVPNKRCGRYISKKAISRMIYLDAVVKESMRLFPVAPFVVRHIDVDIPIQGTKVKLPKGSFACIWIYGLHRNPSIWSEPDSFLPERWLDNGVHSKDEGISNGAYMPFAAGPRMCLGQPIATVVLRIMLARIVSECFLIDEDLSASGKTALELHKEMQAGFTVLPAGGVWLTGVRRSAERTAV